MRINPVHKHWAYVVSEFEAAIARQDAVLSAKESEGVVSRSEYEAGKMHALLMGFAKARISKRESRFDFFKQPARNKHRALISYLESMLRDIYPDNSRSMAFKAGMVDALNNWAVEEKGKITYATVHAVAA